jgi:hypothetical protein
MARPSPPPGRVRASSSLHEPLDRPRAGRLAAMPGPVVLHRNLGPERSVRVRARGACAPTTASPPYLSALSIRLASAREISSRSAGAVDRLQARFQPHLGLFRQRIVELDQIFRHGGQIERAGGDPRPRRLRSG